jgi:hypothetical protein
MPITRLTLDTEMPPVSHYCHVVRAGDWVWLSGMVGMTASGEIPEDTVAQFEIAIGTIDRCLRAAGGRPDQVVKVQIFLTDISERARINPIRDPGRGLGPGRPPHEGRDRGGGLSGGLSGGGDATAAGPSPCRRQNPPPK